MVRINCDHDIVLSHKSPSAKQSKLFREERHVSPKAPRFTLRFALNWDGGKTSSLNQAACKVFTKEMKKVQDDAAKVLRDFEPACRKDLEDMFFDHVKRLSIILRHAKARQLADGRRERTPDIQARLQVKLGGR